MPIDLEDFEPSYLEARQNELPRMMELLAASGFVTLGALAHDLKGTGASYGFPALTRLGAALEQSAKRMDTAAANIWRSSSTI